MQIPSWHLWTGAICPARDAEQITCMAAAQPKSRRELQGPGSRTIPCPQPWRCSDPFPHSLVTSQKEEGAQAQEGARAFPVSLGDQQACKCCEDVAYVTITYVPQTSKGMCGALPEAGSTAKIAPP